MALGATESRNLPQNNDLSTSTQMPAHTFHVRPTLHSRTPPTEAVFRLSSTHHRNRPIRALVHRSHAHLEATPSERLISTQAPGHHDDNAACYEVTCRYPMEKCHLFIALKMLERDTRTILRGIEQRIVPEEVERATMHSSNVDCIRNVTEPAKTMSTAVKLEILSCFWSRILDLQRHELFLANPSGQRQTDLPTFEVRLCDLYHRFKNLERHLRAQSRPTDRLPPVDHTRPNCSSHHLSTTGHLSGQSSPRCSGLEDSCDREAVSVLAALQRFLRHACS